MVQKTKTFEITVKAVSDKTRLKINNEEKSVNVSITITRKR